MSALIIRPVASEDRDQIWAALKPVFRAGDTYAIDPAILCDAALDYWCGAGRSVWVAVKGEQLVGSYYLCANQSGGGAHVCNCGFVTTSTAQGQGVARAMLDHALGAAQQTGYRAMQFNFVVSTNQRALALWQRAGFDVVGRLPKAFRHPTQGYVDAFVLYRALAQP